jgi:hypothetical protein
MYNVGTVARCKRVVLGVLLGSLTILFSFSSFGAGSVNLAWSASPDPAASGYNVYYGNASGSYQNQLQAGTNLSAAVSGLASGRTFFFSVTAVDVFGDESDYSNEISYSEPGVNQPPSISSILNQIILMNHTTPAIPFTVNDPDTGASSVTVSGISSAPAIVPNANIVFGGSGQNRTVTVAPAVGVTGLAQITIIASDGITNVSTSFTLTVQPGNTPPTISAILDQTVTANQPTTAIPFTIGDAETAATKLTVSASSSATTLVPNANIVLGGSGTSRTVKVTPAASQTGTAQITVSVSDGTNSASSSFNVTIQPPAPNTPPTISGIAAQTITANQTTALIAFTVGDAETAAGSLALSGSSSSTTLVPNANIVFGGSGADRTVKVTPAANQTGSAQITVSVSDGTNSVGSSFSLTVQPGMNTPPTISAIPNQTGYVGHSVGPVPFTVGDVETAAGSLAVSAVSSDPSIVPNANIVFGGSGANRTVAITPTAGQIGAANITVTVSDGTTNSQSTFAVSFEQPTALPSSDLPATSTYNGLFYEDDAVRLQSAGSFKVTVTTGGKYSGTMQTAGGRYSFSGQFGTFCQGTNVIVRKGFKSLVLNFGLNAGASPNRFVGSVSDGVFASQMHGVGTTFNAVTHPAPYIGHYTMAVPSGDISTTMSLGNGFSSLSVDGGGNVKLSGMLADGTKVSQSSQISDGGTWPLFVPLYKGKGMLIAWISFTNRSGDDLHGSLNWIKQPDLLAKFYPSGFALAGDAIGSAYAPPSSLELNTQLSRLQTGPGANAVVTSIKATATTGILKGSMIDRATGKTSSFQGVLLQKPNTGYGFVLGVKQSTPVLLTP